MLDTAVRPPRAGTDARLGRRAEAAWLGGFGVLLAALAFLFPLTGDDLGWATHIGSDRLSNFFAGYNGRYAGDLLVLLLTRTSWLAPFVVGAVLAGTLFLVLDLADLRTRLGYPLVAVALLGMPRGVWREAVVWLSGFTNYAVAALVMLLFARWAKGAWTAQARAASALRLAGTALLAFAGALFMEHVTILLVVASVAFAVAFRVRRGRFAPESVAWALGFVAGAGWMFSNSAYRAAVSGRSHGYQQIPSTGLGAKLHKLTHSIADLGFARNTVLVALLVAVLCLVCVRAAPRIGGRRAALAAAPAVAALLLAAALRTRHAGGLRLVPAGAAGLVAALLLLAVAAVAVLVVTDPARRALLLLTAGAVVVLVVPLVLVRPIGPRCFYPSYVLLLVLLAMLVRELTGLWPGSRLLQLAGPVAALAGSALLAGYFAVYGSIHAAEQRRLAQVRSAVAAGQRVVRLTPLPHGSWVHIPDPKQRKWAHRYKLFHHLPADVELVVRRGV